MNLMITKRAYTFVAATLLFAMSGCKDFTELEPLNNLSETLAFSTPENIELSVNGVYQAAAVGEYEGGAGRGYPFGAASTQQGEMRGEDMVNLQAFYAFTYESNYTTVTANNKNHWEQLYALINQANVMIEGVATAVSQGIISADVGAAYEAEGRFLRALSHHELLVYFCRPYADGNGSHPGVPYRTVAVTSGTAVNENTSLGRGTVAQAYTNILADLDFAEQNLPTQRAGATHVSRATSGAAIALKTRVKLHQLDYAGVIVEANKLGATGASPFTSSLGGYQLEVSPDEPFLNNSGNRESIFSVANSAVSNGGVNGALANMFAGSGANPTGAAGGRDLIATSPILWNASFWVDGDLRRELLHFRQTGGTAAYALVYTSKYRSYGVFADWAPIIRYAEVLLNSSEAHARTGNSVQSLALLNAVRDRSVPVSASFGTTPPADLIQAVLNERRIEFTAEGRRWPDIHRLGVDPVYGTGGIPAKIEFASLNGQASYNNLNPPTIARNIVAVPYSDFRFIWPIPQSELQANPTLAGEQNPEY
ncbi:RagB/SusD family nutrient uptake outer membrane protein [Sphingobacterium bambusae]